MKLARSLRPVVSIALLAILIGGSIPTVDAQQPDPPLKDVEGRLKEHTRLRVHLMDGTVLDNPDSALRYLERNGYIEINPEHDASGLTVPWRPTQKYRDWKAAQKLIQQQASQAGTVPAGIYSLVGHLAHRGVKGTPPHAIQIDGSDLGLTIEAARPGSGAPVHNVRLTPERITRRIVESTQVRVLECRMKSGTAQPIPPNLVQGWLPWQISVQLACEWTVLPHNGAPSSSGPFDAPIMWNYDRRTSRLIAMVPQNDYAEWWLTPAGAGIPK